MSATLPLETYIDHLARAPEWLPSKLDVVIVGTMPVSAVLMRSPTSRRLAPFVLTHLGLGPRRLLGVCSAGAFDKASFATVLAAPTVCGQPHCAVHSGAGGHKPAQIAALSERLLVSYADLRSGAPVLGLRFLRSVACFVFPALPSAWPCGCGTGSAAALRWSRSCERVAVLLIGAIAVSRSCLIEQIACRPSWTRWRTHSFFSGRSSLHFRTMRLG